MGIFIITSIFNDWMIKTKRNDISLQQESTNTICQESVIIKISPNSNVN